jgi:hypothetical protein
MTGDVEVAGAIEGEAEDLVELGVGGRAAVTAEAEGGLAGDG